MMILPGAAARGLSGGVCQIAGRIPVGPVAGVAQSSSHRPLAYWLRRAMMSAAPLTVQCMPDCLARWTTIALIPLPNTAGGRL